MFWADRIAEEIKKHHAQKIASGKPLLIRDEKTLSGRVHVGSMRGVAIHGTVAKVLAESGVANEFRYEFNDFDPFDDIPSYLERDAYEHCLGMPLYVVPTPEAGADNYSDYFGKEFRAVIEESGYHPSFYRSSTDLYLAGKMDEAIRLALLGADHIRTIYKEVSGAVRKEGWLPIAVLCEKCKRLSTTVASDFDGETVAYSCAENTVPWAKGCGYTGRISPFGGNAKLPWKVDWPAKWLALGVDIEGGGKDHSTKGGSRDVANRIAREVFHIEPPFDIPYEFFLVGGKKMSSSKGRGSSAKDIADLVPPKLFRLALISKDINQAFNFDPEGETIPLLYDLYDRILTLYKEGTRDDFTRLFELVEEHSNSELPFCMRFSQVAFAAQMPHLNIYETAAEQKGAPLTDLDTKELSERVAYAKQWLASHAPEKYIFSLAEELPEAARDLSPLQRQALARIADMVTDTVTAEELHAGIHALKDELAIPPGELFSAIYLAFLGKKEGPKAGWFVATLDRAFARTRLIEASK